MPRARILAVCVLAIPLIEILSFAACIFSDWALSGQVQNSYRWSGRNSVNRIGIFYQDQSNKAYSARDPLFGLMLRPNSTLAALDTLDGRPHGSIRVDSLGFIPNRSDLGSNETILLRKPEDILVIVTGPHTTSGLGIERNENTFPAQLENWLERKGKLAHKIRVLNAGVPGVVSSQEMLRFQFDLARLNPDLWIQLNGINESWKYGALEGSIETAFHRSNFGYSGRDSALKIPYFPATQKFFSHWLPALLSSEEPAHHKIRPYGMQRSAQRYLEIIRASSAIAQANGAEHFYFLQPIMAYGNRRFSELELSEKSELFRESFWQEYASWANEFYGEAKLLIKAEKNPHWADLSALFDKEPLPVYREGRLYNERANLLLAEEIGKQIWPALQRISSRLTKQKPLSSP